MKQNRWQTQLHYQFLEQKQQEIEKNKLSLVKTSNYFFRIRAASLA